MPLSNNPNIFPCGRGLRPGTQGSGGGGQQPNTTPVVLVPTPPGDPNPPFIPPLIPGPTPAVPSPGIPSPGTPGGPATGSPTGPTGPAGPTGPTGPTTGGTTGPTTGGTTGPSTGGPTGPSTGAPTTGAQFFKCATVALGVCPEDVGNPDLNSASITTIFQECQPCQRLVEFSGEIIADPSCRFRSKEECEQSCESPVFTGNVCLPSLPSTQPTSEPTNRGRERYGTSFSNSDLNQTSESVPQTNSGFQGVSRTPNGDPISVVIIGNQSGNNVILPDPTQQASTELQNSISNKANTQSSQILSVQQDQNATVITVDPIVKDEDRINTRRGIQKPMLFDPNLNFFKSEPSTVVEKVSNGLHLNIFKNKIPVEVFELLVNSNTNNPWNEITLQSLSDDKLLMSLNNRLANSFQYLRFAGGSPIGLSVLLNVIRKHLLEGTIKEFDPEYYIFAALSQISDNFEILEKPDTEELKDRLALNYLQKNSNTFENNKSSSWRNFQMNRVRPLNEDLNLKVAINTLSGIKNLEIPNNGFPINRLTSLSQITSPIVGYTNRINIGDGGGYYVHGVNLRGEGVAIPTRNILSQAFYAPGPIRAKVLDMLDIDPAIKIVATSTEGKHEFVSDDLGASAVKPLFFALDPATVSGGYLENSMVESYSGTYSRLTSESDIDRYVNNHALNISILSLDYRDPIYRYILDTSTLTASLNDFNMVGFEDQGFESLDVKFVKNIPFGFIVTPVAGGKFNPFNGRSTLDKTGASHTRSISVIPATSESVDKGDSTFLRAFSLHQVSGIDRIGVGEQIDTQNIGYQYREDYFTDTFYSNDSLSYGGSSVPVSAQGTAFMLREVIDYLSATYNSSKFTWYDVFSRMPVTRLGEVFYDSDKDFMVKVANGFRDGITLSNLDFKTKKTNRVIDDDSKTIVSVGDREGVTTVRI